MYRLRGLVIGLAVFAVGAFQFNPVLGSDDECYCVGGATFLKLRYNGASGTQVAVNDGGVIIFDAALNDGDEFSLYGGRDNGRFLSNNLVLTAGGADTTIHVSCSTPLDIGLVFGPFTVVNLASREGGYCIPEPSCPTGTNPVDLTEDDQGEVCVASLRPLTTAGTPASFVMTARTMIDTGAPTDPDAAGTAGSVKISDDGAGVKTASCGGSKAISGKGGHQDEELIFTFDAPVSASCVRVGLDGVHFHDSSSSIQFAPTPKADAGADLTVHELAPVMLDATGSSAPQGAPLLFQWTQTAGPAVTLSDANGAQPTFVAPDVAQSALLEFRVEVSSGTQSSIDTVMVAVNQHIPGNAVPVADAGESKAVVERTGVVLDGRGTFDANGDALIYQWVQTQGPPVILYDANSPRARFLAPEYPVPITYSFRLVVTDGRAMSVSSTSCSSSSEDDTPILFISSVGSPGYDYTILTAEIEAAFTDEHGHHGVVPFDALTSLPPGLEIDAFKVRETTGHIYVNMVDRTCLCDTAADCDDGDFCNGSETCDPACGCQPGTAPTCDDDNVCNGTETCDPASGCQSGTPLNCDDGNVCNGVETCDPITGCQSGSPLVCDDGDPCNGDETCNPIVGCQPGPPIDCSALDDACHEGVCNSATGLCEASPTPGASCDDGNACTTSDLCDAGGSCVGTTVNCDDALYCNGVESCDPAIGCVAGTPPNCDDGVACTTDACDEATDSCAHTPVNSACDDGLHCNGVETCDPALGCQAGTPPNCNDGVSCTDDACDEATDSCTHAPDNSVCDDNLHCNGVETCDAVSDCQSGTPPNCDDGVACTVDACDEVNDTCSHAADDSLCDDGLYCNGAESCSATAGCQAGTAPNCDDGIACTVDSCDESGDACVNAPDQGACDDGNSCTDDACVPGTGCVFTPDDSNSCSDGAYCNGLELCVAGVCLAGNDPCHDGVGCTVDACDEAADTCSNTPDNSLCSDGFYCNGNETCDPLNDCQAGTAVDCGHVDDQCNVGACDEALDTCVAQPANENQPCVDGLFCTVGEVCTGGSCGGGTARDCGDGVGCTVDTCDDNADQCVNTADHSLCDNGEYCDGSETCDPVNDCQPGSNPCPGLKCHEVWDQCVDCLGDSWCDDGLYCNGSETCVGGVCQPGTPPCGSDGVSCTVDGCDEVGDVCTHVPDNALCADGQYCSGVETCDPLNDCQPGTAVDCDDGVGCTVDQCDEAKDMCLNLPNSSLCDDTLYCTGVETCDAIADCQPGTPIDCSHLNDQCNLGACDDSLDTCVQQPANEGLGCDDGAFCSVSEMCSGGACGGGVARDCADLVDCTVDSCDEAGDTCVHTPQNSLCDDGNVCTDDTCDAAAGCVFTPDDTNSCDDGLFCNGPEICSGGTCQTGADPCDDGVACTTDSCDESTDTCTHLPQASLCSDGQFCNGVEICDVLTGCQSGPAVDCDDTVSCTVDVCDENKDLCLNTPNHSACDDTLYCTGVELCDALAGCQPGTPVNCDDSVTCTVDSCDDVADTCLHTPTDSLCNDGQHCNGVETCDALLGCQSGTAPDCDDTVACTIDACDEVTDTCTHTPDDGACSDSDVCTGTETCNPLSGCQPGTPLVCDDMNPCTDDSCDAVQGCQTTPDDTNSCELDGTLCTIDLCVGGVCQTDTVTCPPDEECATFACNPMTGVCDASPINEGLPCLSDGNECTNDLCVAGMCDHPDVANDTPCTDDGNECTDDVCLLGDCSHPDILDGSACASDQIACTLDVCVTGVCENDPLDDFCEDHQYCTGTEICDPAVDCVSSGDPCPAAEVCCESSDVCATECCDDTDCDDTNLCTTDACVAGVCQNTLVTCPDDGLYCTGTEACDPATGLCTSSGIPCSAPAALCCEDSDICVAQCCSDAACDDGDLCTTDLCVGGSCVNAAVVCADDGRFCTGTASCDPGTGLCVSSGFACPPDQVCCEISQSCEEQCTVIPTVSEWGLIALALMLLTGAKVYYGGRSAQTAPVRS